MPVSPYRLILRYQIDPEWEAEARLEDLIQFCERSFVDEVMLLIGAEELSRGHLSSSELDRYISLACRMKERLASTGRTLSLNPWTTLFQIPRGRRLGEEHPFRPMVGETGEPSPISVCPLCEKWQEWQAGILARMAKDIRPTAIWLDDDFRLHNHGPELGWGGCFCDEHLRRFSEKTGQTVTRDEVLDAVLNPGKPHPWRYLWFELSRETLLEPLQRLRTAVKAANPEVALAQMSSMPDQHAVEGRDWEAMRKAFADKGTLLARPHMPPYTQATALQTVPSVTRQTLACFAGPVHAYPELENSPRCGVYSQDASHTALQMLEGVLITHHGITLNHFDNMGNGTALDPHLAAHLAAVRPQLDAIAALGTGEANAIGAQVLFSQAVAAHLELPAREGPRPAVAGAELSQRMERNPSGGGGDFSGSMQSLVHNSLIWGQTLGILGIAHRFNTRIEPERGPIFVNGQTLNAFEDSEIEKLLAGLVVLDAVAFEGLEKRGYQAALGVQSAGWHSLDEAIFSYERIESDDAGLFGIARPRMCAQRCASRVLKLLPRTASTLSVLCTPSHDTLWPAATISHTPQGGAAIVLTYPLDGSAQFFMAFFNRFRRIFFQNLLLKSAASHLLACASDGTRCYRHQVDAGELFSVFNVTSDPMDEVLIALNDPELEKSAWSVLLSDGSWQEILPNEAASGHISFPKDVPALSAAFLLRQNQN